MAEERRARSQVLLRVHVGIEKTASSHLQMTAAFARDRLAEHGIEFLFGLIDINGRRSAGVALPPLAGMHLPWVWYQVFIGASDLPHMAQHLDVRVRWLVGDAIGLVEHATSGKARKALSALRPVRGCHHDDFHWDDPLPLFGDAMDYLWKFLKSRGSTRPDVAGMVSLIPYAGFFGRGVTVGSVSTHLQRKYTVSSKLCVE